MASPSVSYTLSNGSTVDADQLNTNYQDIISSLTDGTKSLVIDALTCNGAANFKGNVTFGDATGDDITFTGRIASSLTPKTDATYALGTSALAWSALYVEGSTSLDGAVVVNDSSADVDFRVESNNNANMFFVDGGNDRLGSGTGTPEVPLHLYKSDNNSILLQTANDTNGKLSTIYFQVDATGNRRKAGIFFERTGLYGVGKLHLATEGTADTSNVEASDARITIDKDGNVGIGTATLTTAKFEVLESGTAWTTSIHCSSATPSGLLIDHDTDSNDTTQKFINCLGDTTNRMIVYSNGDVYTSTGTAIQTIASDRNLKTDIKPYDSVLDNFMKLKPCHFKWKRDGTKGVGYIAQEVEEAFPGSLTTRESTDAERPFCGDTYHSYKMDWYVVLTKAIQEQQAMINELKAEVAKLKSA